MEVGVSDARVINQMVREGKKGRAEEEGVKKQASGDSFVSSIMDLVTFLGFIPYRALLLFT